MIHLRILAPADLADRVLAQLSEQPTVVSLAHVRGAATKPAGDLILCEVPRENASVVIEGLRELGVDKTGSISLEAVEGHLSEAGRRAVEEAPGSPSDAVVWDEVEERTSESAELSGSFLAFMVIATLIAGVGILNDSQVLIIGAMVVGPEFGPLAGICVALVSRSPALARRSLVALAAGFPLAIAVTLLATLAGRSIGIAPHRVTPVGHPSTIFISHPNGFSVVVAILAGVAGMLSLTTAKSGALIGVLISVTTIPAAGNVAVATAYRDWNELGGAAEQLVLNLACLIVAGTATLTAQRLAYRRRLARAA